jgi:hypothetical protein
LDKTAPLDFEIFESFLVRNHLANRITVIKQNE